MNATEWKSFSDELFVSFPGLLKHINDSPKPTATLASWQETLDLITLDEARSVLNAWKTGQKDPPKAFERDYTAIVIRQSVMFDRDRKRRFETPERLRQEQRELAKQADRRRKNYVSPLSDLSEAFEIAKKALERYQSGEITKVEYDRICWEATK